MQEIDADAIQLSMALRESVEPGFDSAPVVIARPIFADFLHVLERNPLRRIRNGLRVGRAGGAQALFQILEIRVADLNLERPDFIAHGLLLRSPFGVLAPRLSATSHVRRCRMKPSMLVWTIRCILHDANVHRLSNCYSNRLSCVVIDEARGTFEEDIVQALVDIELAKRLQRVVAAALHLDGKLIAPAPRQPYSLLGRPEANVLAEDAGLGQEVAPLSVDPPLPGHVNLAPDAVLSGVNDPAHDRDTRQRIIVAPVLWRSLLNEALDAEFVLGVHYLLRDY